MLSSVLTYPITLLVFLLCLVSAGALGMLTAAVFRFRSRESASFTLTLSLLPMVVAVVIMLVNGNVGTGIAVAGAFTLVRFRSAPGSAREIAAIFTCMALGLAAGMGYLGIAAILFVCVAAVTLVMTLTGWGKAKGIHKQLKITIPENMDYDQLFDGVFAAHGVKAELTRIKTTAMGTLFDLTYDVTLPTPQVPKALLDDLRARNGNLSIMIGAAMEQETL